MTLARPLGLGALLLLLAAVVPACNAGGGRFPACKSDAECASRSTAANAPLCYELRCVACRSDTDCPGGHACSPSNECKRFTESPAAGDAGAAEPVERETWEQSTPEDRDRCLAACKGKGKECAARCGQKPKK